MAGVEKTAKQPQNKHVSLPWNDPKAEPYIRLENVTKKFGEFVAVNNVSLNIYRGELFSLLGGSGCGKTTLLRMLAGFETPTAGKIYIDGADMAGIPPYDRPTNMMFQSYALFPHMTVEQNVAFGLKQDQYTHAEIKQRVAQILDMVQLTPFAKRKPHQLSGGQRQRVALARSLVKQPKLLLLDEPLGALDKKLREATQFEIMNIQDRLGITFIVVTHDQEEAMTLSTRISVMNAGQIVQTGTPQNIYEYPQNKFVADFIGSVNLFEGQIIEDEQDHVLIRSEEAGGDIYIDHGISSAPGAQVWVAIRPEKIQLTKQDSKEPHNRLKGVVKSIAYMGNLSIYLVQLDSGKQIKVSMPNQVRGTEFMIDWDERVSVTWHPNSPVTLLS
ncbi:MAG: ABC transporter ATP-binding protein [Mesorhizobium sp.]|uniref:ABC transporter ATP-binding protein n=1 Tax=Mesorhizobium sp. TaxID=1871066 RepID=UPI000FE6345B|nr:ABC transporter ATP-binding protein [Mesorhizobium sp.]RWJ39838.1 MAG: ABC transporter ATP-binding protein [Mesorhizobium sp.]RWJ81435.1 MAG: ABC transporter ATP-binding protein [Mesorhizobium sp.]TIR08821.1 MAG: ABC transporter ATP-binding protein [Mesorhizobium sp.]